MTSATGTCESPKEGRQRLPRRLSRGGRPFGCHRIRHMVVKTTPQWYAGVSMRLSPPPDPRRSTQEPGHAHAGIPGQPRTGPTSSPAATSNPGHGKRGPWRAASYGAVAISRAVAGIIGVARGVRIAAARSRRATVCWPRSESPGSTQAHHGALVGARDLAHERVGSKRHHA